MNRLLAALLAFHLAGCSPTITLSAGEWACTQTAVETAGDLFSVHGVLIGAPYQTHICVEWRKQ